MTRRRMFGAFLGMLAMAAAGAWAQPAALTARQAGEDFDAMWRAVDEGHAGLSRGSRAWRRAREAWRPKATRARSRDELVEALEGALATLHDDGIELSERTPRSPRRVPADIDLWARWVAGAATIEAVRTYGDADVAGFRAGHVVTHVDGKPVEAAVRALTGPGAPAAARDWALRHVLAGPWTGTLRVTVREGAGARMLEIERRAANGSSAAAPPLLARRIGERRDLGYLRIKDSLADPRLPERFDAALNYLKDTRALILDLRETSRRGSRAITEALLGRFVAAPATWQLRQGRGAERAADRVSPRGASPYRAPVVVLVDRWTAGEGEALASGLHAVAGARLVGTSMAGIGGEMRDVRLPHSGIVLRFPAQRTFLPGGTPREALRPAVAIDLAAPQGGPGDPILYQALKLLER